MSGERRMIPTSDLDRLLLSFCDTRWQKVARIVGKTMQVLEQQGVQIDGSIADQIDARIAVLVSERRVGKGATRRAHVVKPRGLRCAQPTLHIRLIGRSK